jgi:succinate dehydrogenase assembly factor 2
LSIRIISPDRDFFARLPIPGIGLGNLTNRSIQLDWLSKVVCGEFERKRDWFDLMMLRRFVYGYSLRVSSLPVSSLPGSSLRALYSTESGKIEFKIEPLPRPGEDTDTKRARLLYQSRKRGILEADLILSKFAKLYLPTMSREELDEYDKLLDLPDWDIYYWATRNNDMKQCPERWENSPIMAKLREVAENKDREILRMPDL